MNRRYLSLAVAALMLVGASVALAAGGPSKHKLSDDMKLRVLTANPSKIVQTGTIHDRTAGDGAVIVNVTPTKETGKANYLATAFFKKGEITVKGTITTTQNPDGSTSYVAPFRAVSGTDAYKLVKGKGKVTGVSLPEDPTYGNYKVTGTLAY